MTKTLLYAVAGVAVLTVLLAGQTTSGRLLVLNKEDATFVIVNPDSGAILGKVPVGDGPHELITSSDGKYAFASNYGIGSAPGHTISMIVIEMMVPYCLVFIASFSACTQAKLPPTRKKRKM